MNSTPTPRNYDSSFCVARPVLDALLKADGCALEIASYLTLACFTDATGVYSSASLKAICKYTGCNKTVGGTIDKAIGKLLQMRAVRVTTVGTEDLGPILFTRDGWLAANPNSPIPDGPHAHSKIQYVLPDFDEALENRVWFGSALVSGDDELSKPLRTLKHAGDSASRLLLCMYASNDPVRWRGIAPIHGPHVKYQEFAEQHLSDDCTLFQATAFKEPCIPNQLLSQVLSQCELKGSQPEQTAVLKSALDCLKSVGFLFESVWVLDRPTHSVVEDHFQVPADAEPTYLLGNRGITSGAEDCGIGHLIAKTAVELGFVVPNLEEWNETGFCAIVPTGFSASIIGIFQLRFRVMNPSNLPVQQSIDLLEEARKSALRRIGRLRASEGLAPLAQPRR